MLQRAVETGSSAAYGHLLNSGAAALEAEGLAALGGGAHEVAARQATVARELLRRVLDRDARAAGEAAARVDDGGGGARAPESLRGLVARLRVGGEDLRAMQAGTDTRRSTLLSGGPIQGKHRCEATTPSTD